MMPLENPKLIPFSVRWDPLEMKLLSTEVPLAFSNKELWFVERREITLLKSPHSNLIDLWCPSESFALLIVSRIRKKLFFSFFRWHKNIHSMVFSCIFWAWRGILQMGPWELQAMPHGQSRKFSDRGPTHSLDQVCSWRWTQFICSLIIGIF